MQWLWAELLALILAFGWNRVLCAIGLQAWWRVGVASPLGEELIKYGIAGWVHLPLAIFCFIFGLGEGLYETLSLRRRFDFILVLTGALTHLGFGLLYVTPVPAWIGLLFAILLHILWNFTVIIHTK